MKRIISLLLAMIIFSLTLPASASGLELYYDGEYHTYTGTLYKLIVNGEQLKVPLDPITFNNRSLVPIREVFEALGAKVDFINETREVIISGNNIDIKMQIANPIAYVNGEEVEVPGGVAPKLITKVGVVTKTMVPVRFVSERLGMQVDWSGERGEIVITGSVGADEEEKLTIKSPVITKKNSTTTVITIASDKAITGNINPNVTSAGVLYFDIADAVYEGVSKTDVNHAAVLAVRYGLHDDYTRVAIDMQNYKNYAIETSADKKEISITVVAKEGAAESGEEEDNTDNETESESEETTPAEEEITVTVDLDAMKKYTASNGIKYVVIDAGHGGKDSGAVGSITEVTEVDEAASEEATAQQIIENTTTYYEKTINLAVAKLVQKNLQDAGVKVIMTRTGDTYPTLSERSVLANQNDAAMFVSIHVNSAANAPNANGIEVYYANKNNNDFYGLTSKKFASTVLDKMLEETDARSRGVKSENYYVIRTSLMPAILIEVGFISNADEIKQLIDPAYQQKLADGISAGILAHIDDVTVPDRRELAENLVAAEIGEGKAKEYMNEKW